MVQKLLIQRRCRGNRYCNFVGAFSPHRLLFLPLDGPVVVGACWAESLEHPGEPRRFVCSRCAHRTLVYERGVDPVQKVWLLCCPFDGEPLGRGDATLLFAGGEVVRRFDRLPEPEDLAAVLTSLFPAETASLPETAYDRLGLAIERFKAGAYAEALVLCEQVCELEPDRPLAWKIRSNCLARLGRPEEARKVLERIR